MLPRPYHPTSPGNTRERDGKSAYRPEVIERHSYNFVTVITDPFEHINAKNVASVHSLLCHDPLMLAISIMVNNVAQNVKFLF